MKMKMKMTDDQLIDASDGGELAFEMCRPLRGRDVTTAMVEIGELIFQLAYLTTMDLGTALDIVRARARQCERDHIEQGLDRPDNAGTIIPYRVTY
jgi:hypothetical protein